MSFKKFCSVLSIVALLSATGCSGSRLRNLFARSEYLSLEELEGGAEDGRVSDSTDARDRLVSRERVVSDEDDQTDDKSSESRFSEIAGLFRGRESDTKVTPDPFVETEQPEIQTAAAERDQTTAETVAQVSNEKPAESPEPTREEQTAEQLIVESTAPQSDPVITESLFDSQLEISPASDAADSFAAFAAEQTTPTSSDADPTLEKDFASSMTGQQRDTAATSETTEAPAKKSPFDAMLADTFPPSARPAEPEDAATIIADASEEYLPEPPSPATAAFEEIIGNAPADVPQDNAGSKDDYSDMFTEAAEKHGFRELSSQDPWAAFSERKAAWAQTPQEPKPVASEDDELTWDQITEPAENDSSDDNLDPNDFFASDSELPAPAEPAESPEFAFSELVAEDEEEEFAATALVIPGGEEYLAPTPDLYAQEQANADVEESDPFMNASFEQELLVDTELPLASAPVAAAVDPQPRPNWFSRNWMLLVGCIIAAGLLFLPNRQKYESP